MIDSNTFNMIMSIALVVSIIAVSGVQLVAMFTNHPVSWAETLIISLMGLLQAYRHIADVRSGNGSSGLTPPKDGTE